MTDEPLTPDEQTALDALPAEMAPPPALEDRVVARLREAGLIRRPVRLWVARAAAAAALFLAGYGTARWTPPATAPAAPATADARGQYLLLLYGAESTSPAEEASRFAEYSAWAGEQARAGRLVGAERLADQFEVFGEAGHGPANPSEPLGFFLIRADDATQAAAIAAACPHVRHGGTVVLRPVSRPPSGAPAP
ncbi:MAG: YciI family protein [Vicinamibacterales bacterium]